MSTPQKEEHYLKQQIALKQQRLKQTPFVEREAKAANNVRKKWIQDSEVEELPPPLFLISKVKPTNHNKKK